MAATIVSDVQTKYDALGVPGMPAIYFGQAPQAGASQIRPPYVVLTVEKPKTERLSESERLMTYPVVFAVYANTLSDVEDYARAIQYGGGAEGDGDGFNDGTMTLTVGTLNDLIPTGDPEYFLEPQKDRLGANMHGCRLRYDIEVQVTR